MIESLISSHFKSTDAVISYCHKNQYDIPFVQVWTNGKLYARTKDIINLNVNRDFVSQRSHYKQFYINLGSIHLSDTSLRREVVKDYRLLNTWLHNSKSVFVILLMHDKNFKEYIGVEENINYRNIINILNKEVSIQKSLKLVA